MLWREIRQPIDVVYKYWDIYGNNVTRYEDYESILCAPMQKAHRIAGKDLNAQTRHQKETYDLQFPVYQFHEGAGVWYLNETWTEGALQSFCQRIWVWDGIEDKWLDI